MAWPAARDLLLGECCACCGAGGEGLVCRHCRPALRPTPAVVQPAVPPPGFPPTTAACPYVGAVRHLVVVHKEHGRLAAAVPLGQLLAAAVAAGGGDGPLVLVPVPSRPGAVRARGHDPVARMARVAARWLAAGESARVVPALRHARQVADQSGLDRAHRWTNLAGALELRAGPPAAAGQVVVVDDVCSSGATLAAAAAALAPWGRAVRAAVVAAPPRRDGWR